MRSLYGRLFFQVSVYSRRGARVDYLAKKFASSKNSSDQKEYRGTAENIVQKDENQVGEPYGQRVSKIFHDADFIINNDLGAESVKDQIEIFCELLFSSNRISPTKLEYGMYAAKGAALRTLDLSRQVGAAIFSQTGEIISMGSNEVPRAMGGTYWCDDPFDDREYKRGFDSNDNRKKQLLREIISHFVNNEDDIESIVDGDVLSDVQLMDALEYGRIVHAEMSAISDAARLGLPLKGASMFTTTFPCHMCAKHIIVAGLAELTFLEPYPKSLASDLHSDSIRIEGEDRGQYEHFPYIKFEHFYGITPRRYRELFERTKRKDKKGNFVEYGSGKPIVYIEYSDPHYKNQEQNVVSGLSERFIKVIKMDSRILEG